MRTLDLVRISDGLHDMLDVALMQLGVHLPEYVQWCNNQGFKPSVRVEKRIFDAEQEALELSRVASKQDLLRASRDREEGVASKRVSAEFGSQRTSVRNSVVEGEPLGVVSVKDTVVESESIDI